MQPMEPVQLLLRVSDLLGVAVFAASGVLAAGRTRLDLLGVFVVAMVTAIGGGTLRDLLLGRTPVFWVTDAIYLLVIIFATAVTVLYTRFSAPPLKALLVADALGLALFSITGAQVAEEIQVSWVVIAIMGATTGAAGGMMRDVLCNEIPLVLRGQQLYATASLVGVGVYCASGFLGGSKPLSTVIGMLTVLALRFASIFFAVGLPVYGTESEKKNF